jgi:hypothetical protein
MTSREEELAAKLKGYLDQAATDLRPGLAYRLQQARAQAIARLTENPQEAGSGRLVGAHGLLGAGAGGANLSTSSPQRPFLAQGRVWLGVGLIALAALGWQQWTAWQELNEVEDLDAQILTSDLPVDALIDRGFHLFLEVAPTLALMPAPPGEDAAGTMPEAVPAVAPGPDAEPARAMPAAAKPAE